MSEAEKYIKEAAERKGWYKYYMLERPCSIGMQPSRGLMDFINYDEKVRAGVRSFWAEVYYDRKLTAAELEEYEMMKA